MVFQEIKDELNKARVLRWQTTHINILTTLIGELERSHGKCPTDEHVYATIRKMIKDIETCLRHTDKQEVKDKCSEELRILSAWLPPVLTIAWLAEYELTRMKPIDKSNIGACMKEVKALCAEHNILFDGAVCKKFFEMTK